jgi:Ni2+-binding GTPase involved in maturation of urease and hydrogenase
MRHDPSLSIAAVTNDIFTKEDAEFMVCETVGVCSRAVAGEANRP